MTQPATTQELIADVLLPYFGDDEIAYTAADAIVRDPALTIRPRRIINRGDWEHVRNNLDLLPDGAQICWNTGMPTRPELAVKRMVFREYRWATTSSAGYLTSENIARDNTPIEVIA